MTRAHRPWSEAELAIVRDSVGLSAEEIVERLAAAGFTRTVAATSYRRFLQHVSSRVKPAYRVVPRPASVRRTCVTGPQIAWRELLDVAATLGEGDALHVTLPPNVPPTRAVQSLFWLSRSVGVSLVVKVSGDGLLLWPRKSG